MSPLRNSLLILMTSTLVLCEQMDWGDNLYLVEESDTIQGREHIKQLVMLEGDTSNLECQVAFTSHPVSQFRWKIDGKPESKKVTNSSVVTKNGEVFVEEHLVIENITKFMDSSTVSCEYSKGHYGAGVEAILRVFGLDIVIEREVWQACFGDVRLVFRESNRFSPAEETVDKRIKSNISDLTKSDKITVDNSGYSVFLPIANVMANEAILAMNPKLIINGTQVTNTVAQCGSLPPQPRKHTEVSTTEAGDIITESYQTAEIDPKYVDYTADIEHNHTVDMERMDEQNTILIFIIIIATAVFLFIKWRSDCGKCRGKGTHECQDSGSEPEDERLFQIIV